MPGGRSTPGSTGSGRGISVKGNSTGVNRAEKMHKVPPKEPDVFQFDEFKRMANVPGTMQTFNGEDLKQYKDALADIEKNIREKKSTQYDKAVKSLKKVLDKKKTSPKIKALTVKLDKMNSYVEDMKRRGGDYFQNIQLKEDTPGRVVTSVTPKDTSTTSTDEKLVFKRLLEIEEMCEGSTAGAKLKAKSERRIGDVLTAIETWCRSTIEERQKADGLAGIHAKANDKSKIKVVVDWIIKFEKQMKEVSPKEEEFKHQLPANDDLNAIREIFQRMIHDTKKREEQIKTLEKENIVLVKKVMSLISDDDSATKKDKKPTSNEEKDVNQLLNITLSNLNTQIDDLNNQTLRLNEVTVSMNKTNGILVTDKKKTPNSKQSDKQSKQLTAIFEKDLKQLEEECTRYQAVVKQVDKEIENLEKDLENWPEVKENVKELEKVEECSMKAIRTARLKLQQYKKGTGKNSKQDNMKDLTQAISKVCIDNGIDVSKKKNEYVDMIKQLDIRLKRDRGLEEENIVLVKQVMSLISEEDSTTKKGKKPTSNEENNVNQLLKITLTNLNTGLDDLSNQALRLQNVTVSMNKTSGTLVTDKKKTPNSKQPDKQSKQLTAIFEKDLKQLEEECTRYQAVVNQVDKEIGNLEKDLENWPEVKENVKELEKVDECSMKAVRSARLKLQQYKTATGKNSKQDNMKDLTQAISKVCIDYGIDVSKMKDEYVDMITELDTRLKKDRECLKTLEIELTTLQEVEETKEYNPTPPKINIELKPLVEMAKNAKTYLHKLQQERNRMQENETTMDRFADDIEPRLKKVINMLTNKLPTSQKQIPELPPRYASIFVKVRFIESVSEQCLHSLCTAYDIIIGRPFREPKKSNKKEGNYSELNIDDCMQSLVGDATSEGITRENVSQLTRDTEDYKHNVQKLERKVVQWKAAAESEEKEKMEYMTRLSKVASAKLTDNNPNIADLSDPNRQTKLAEEYGQLYDNEWTNAFEDVATQQPDEESIINCLLQVLMTVYDKCVDMRTQQLTGMKMALLQPAHYFCLLNNGAGESTSDETGKESKKKGEHNPDDLSLGAIQSQAITELGKQTYSQALQDITKYFQRRQADWFDRKNIAIYTTKCIEICWLMNIHSPPVYLDANVKKGAAFDKTKYREYTARGKKVKFLVWPTILLHKDGPTLGKGIAQCMG